MKLSDVLNLLLTIGIYAVVVVFIVIGAYYMIIGLLGVVETVFLHLNLNFKLALMELLGGVFTMLADIFLTISVIMPMLGQLPEYKIDIG